MKKSHVYWMFPNPWFRTPINNFLPCTYVLPPPKKTRVKFFSPQNFFQKTIISHPATMSNQDHPHFVLFFFTYCLLLDKFDPEA